MRKWIVLIAASFVAACGPQQAAVPSASVATASASTPSAVPTPALWRPAAAPAGAPPGSQWIAVDTFDGKAIVASVQSSSGNAPSPFVVFLHPDGGLRRRHIDFASSFAKEGYITVTPCWQRYVDPKNAEPFGCSADAPERTTAAEMVKDVMAVIDAARTLPGARSDRAAIVGHSAGAMAGVLTASMGGRVDSVVAISAGYGLAIRQRWGTALPDQVDGLAVPLLIVHGTNDTNAPGTAVGLAREYEKTALSKGKTVGSIYVEGAPHTLPYLPEYWTTDVKTKVLAFLAKNLAR